MRRSALLLLLAVSGLPSSAFAQPDGSAIARTNDPSHTIAPAGPAPVASAPADAASRHAPARRAYRRAFGYGVVAHFGSGLFAFAVAELAGRSRTPKEVAVSDDVTARSWALGIALVGATFETQTASFVTARVARHEARRRGLHPRRGFYFRAWGGHLLGRALTAVLDVPVALAIVARQPELGRDESVPYAATDALALFVPMVARAFVGSALAASFVDRQVIEGPVVSRRRRTRVAPPSLTVSDRGAMLVLGGAF